MGATVCDALTERKLDQHGDNWIADGCLITSPDGTVSIGIGPALKCAEPVPGKLSLYAPDFFLTDATPWLVYGQSARIETQELMGWLTPLEEPAVNLTWQPSPYEDFSSVFDDIQSRLASGNLIKAVPFIKRESSSNIPLKRTILNALERADGQNLRAYGFWNPREGLIGTTPELLFEERVNTQDTKNLITMALAGTRGLDSQTSLLDDPKEVTEHRIVVNAIAEDLAPLGKVQLGPTSEVELPTLAHLYTPIEVQPSREVAFGEWVSALHPTPAIGAWPRKPGLQWLKSQPNASDRGRYGAPFGYTDPESGLGTCLVAIRNVQWGPEGAKILAGCGIIRASQVDREWRELNSKLDSIQSALGLQTPTLPQASNARGEAQA